MTGMLDGRVYHWPDGTRYEGCWAQGQPCGPGRWTCQTSLPADEAVGYDAGQAQGGAARRAMASRDDGGGGGREDRAEEADTGEKCYWLGSKACEAGLGMEANHVAGCAWPKESGMDSREAVVLVGGQDQWRAVEVETMEAVELARRAAARCTW